MTLFGLACQDQRVTEEPTEDTWAKGPATSDTSEDRSWLAWVACGQRSSPAHKPRKPSLRGKDSRGVNSYLCAREAPPSICKPRLPSITLKGKGFLRLAGLGPEVVKTILPWLFVLSFSLFKTGAKCVIMPARAWRWLAGCEQ